MPITINGATAAQWIESGKAGGFQAITLEADPAGSGLVNYSGSGPDPMFDATDRDNLINGDTLFGIGVNNTAISSGNPGVTSIPSEIGYYGKTPDSFFPDGSKVDSLTVALGEDVTGVNAKVSFFYSSETPGEQFKYQLLDDGNVVAEELVTASGTGSFSSSNPGLFSFNLNNTVQFDAITFNGFDANVADASDFLLEEITVEKAEEVFNFPNAVSNVVVYADCEGDDGLLDTKIKFDGFDEITNASGEPVEIFSLSSGMFEDALTAAGFVDCEALGVTIKAGNNDGGFGPGEGEFRDLVYGDALTTGNTEKADVELAAANYADIWLG